MSTARNRALVPPAVADPSLDRRRFLRNGGLVLSLGAIVAACGDGRGGSDDPGRVGVAPSAPELPDAEVNDVVLLRTAQSLEHVALEAYAVAKAAKALDQATTDVIDRFVADHTAHADQLGTLITAAGGEAFACANPFIMDRAITPILDAIADTDDAARDLVHMAHALESLAAETYQDLVGRLTDPELRREAMLIGADEARHAATLAISIAGADGYVDPTITGGEAPADQEFPPVYAVPASFGQLSGVDLVLGAPNSEGVRTRISLQTPAENTFVYEGQSC
jgi:rubrerythrin